MSSTGRTPITSASDLGVDQAGIAVAPGAPDAKAAGPVCLVEHNADRCGEGVVPLVLERIVDFLQTGLVAYCRPGIGLGPVALGRVLVP